MNHMEIHKLERRMAEVLEKGFLRQPQPEGKGFDRADCVQAAHDIAEMILGDYWIASHPEEEPNFAKMVGDVMVELNKMSDGLGRWAGLTGEER
jgi:hypothetical protein